MFEVGLRLRVRLRDEQGAAGPPLVLREGETVLPLLVAPVLPVLPEDLRGTKFAEIECQSRRAAMRMLDEPRLIAGSMIGGCGCW